MPGASDIKAGGAYIEIGGIAIGLEKELSKASKKLTEFGSSLQNYGKRFVGVGLAMQSAIGLAAQRFASYGTEISNLSKKTGMSTDFISKMGHALKINEADTSDLIVAMRGLSNAMADVSDNKKLQQTFETLNVNWQELKQMKPEDQFMKLIDVLSKHQNVMERNAMAQDIFSRSYMSLIPFMLSGTDALVAWGKEAERFGLVLTPQMIEQAERLDDMWDRMKASLQGLALTVGSIVAPRIETMLTVITNLIANLQNFIKSNPQVIESFQKLAIVFTAFGASLIAIGVAIKGVGILLSPAGLIFAGIATLLYLGGALDDNIKRFKNWASEIKIGATSVLDVINKVSGMWHDLIPTWKAGLNLFKGLADTAWKYITAGAKNMIQEILNLLSSAMFKMSEKIALGSKFEQDFIAPIFTKLGIGLSCIATEMEPGIKESRIEAMASHALYELFDVFTTQASLAGDEIKNKFISIVGDIAGKELPTTFEGFADVFKGIFTEFFSPENMAGLTSQANVLAPAGKIDQERRVIGTFSGAAAGLLGAGPRSNIEQLNQLKIANKFLESIDNQISEVGSLA